MRVTTEVSVYEFREWFTGSQYQNNFNYEQLEILYNAIDQYADEDGVTPYGDDITAICCEYSGYDREELLGEGWSYEYDIKDYDEDEHLEAVIKYLEENTQVYYDEAKDNFIVVAF